MFFEQYSHEPNIATLRFILSYLQKADEYREVLEKKRRYTLADIALYAYTHVANQGGFSLEHYPGIRVWLDRIKIQPNYLPI